MASQDIDMKIARRGGVLSFVTWVVSNDGRKLLTARRRRKRLPAHSLENKLGAPIEHEGRKRNQWSRFWAPARLAWWLAILFMIGAACFALGGAAATWPKIIHALQLNVGMIGWIFFVGSIFFTSAAYLQYLEALNNDLGLGIALGRKTWRYFGWQGGNIGLLAAAVQLAGTLLFNFNTGDALIANLSAREQDVLIWAPNMVGSVCFLLSSQLCLMEFSHGWYSFVPRALAWWIIILNLLGSVLFQISAIVSFVSPSGQLIEPWLANFGTFAGAVCFFVGSYLLIPELFEDEDATG